MSVATGDPVAAVYARERMRRALSPCLTVLAALLIGCGTPIRFDLVRPARVTPPGPGTPYQVLALQLPAPAPLVVAGAPPPPPPQPSSGGLVVVVPVPAQAAAFMREPAGEVGPYEVARLDASAELAERVRAGVSDALQHSPSPHQILVLQGGRVLVAGQVLEASYVETEAQRQTRCDHEVTDRSGRTRTERVACVETTRHASVQGRIELRVLTVEGQVLFADAIASEASADSTGRAALDGTWANAPPPLEPRALLDQAFERIVTAAQHVVVPWREPITVEWLDASGYPAHDLAREHAGAGRFEESLALLDAMLGTPGLVRPSGRDEAHLLANRSVIRLAMGRYAEALADMEASVDFLPGCIAGDLLRWTREIVAEQGTVRAQGVTQPLGARTQ